MLPATTVDIDECLKQYHNCNENALCTDIIGSFECDCLPGYMGNGVNCTSKLFSLAVMIIHINFFSTVYTDIDECTTGTHNCDMNALCTDTDGSFNCTCNSGYEGNGTLCLSKFIIRTLWGECITSGYIIVLDS